MPSMSRVEQAFCRSGLWRRFTQRAVLPWALQQRELRGSVLEIGGGNGAMAEALLRHSPDITLTTTDYDAAMVESARHRLAPFGDRVHIEQVDATKLPYDNARFDAVVSFIMLHHVIDWEPAIGEAVRVVRPGGIVLGYDLLDSTMTRLSHWLDRSEARPMRVAEVRTRVAALPVQADIREEGRGLVVRFAFTKHETPTAVGETRSGSEPVRA